MEEVNYVLRLTGSSFFDTVVVMRAQELSKKYPGVAVHRDGHNLTIVGQLEHEHAVLLREELDYSDF